MSLVKVASTEQQVHGPSKIEVAPAKGDLRTGCLPFAEILACACIARLASSIVLGGAAGASRAETDLGATADFWLAPLPCG